MPQWRELIDMPTTTPILTEIFGSPNYIVYGTGGDIVLPGAIEYQGLHSDNVWTELHDPICGITMRDLPVPAVDINFPLVDLTTENGTIRQIPGSHRSRAPIPRSWPTSRSGCGSARSVRCPRVRQSSGTPVAGTVGLRTCR